MAVFKKYKGMRISSDHPNWNEGRWYVWTRVGDKVLHKSLRGVTSEAEAKEIENTLVRKIAAKVEAKTASSLARRVNRSAKTVRPEYVYILESGGFFKIGRSLELEKRWKALADTIIPFETFIVYTVRVGDSKTVEALVHERFARFRTRGEWFILQSRELRKLMDFLTDKSSYLGGSSTESQPTIENRDSVH